MICCQTFGAYRLLFQDHCRNPEQITLQMEQMLFGFIHYMIQTDWNLIWYNKYLDYMGGGEE